jgi:transcription initiation factor TFIIB
MPNKIKNGRDPNGISAAVIYVVTKDTDDYRTQKEISNVVGVTEVTLRTRYKEILENKSNV